MASPGRQEARAEGGHTWQRQQPPRPFFPGLTTRALCVATLAREAGEPIILAGLARGPAGTTGLSQRCPAAGAWDTCAAGSAPLSSWALLSILASAASAPQCPLCSLSAARSLQGRKRGGGGW